MNEKNQLYYYGTSNGVVFVCYLGELKTTTKKRFKKSIATSKKALTLLYIIVRTRLHSKTINVHRCKGLLLLFKASKFQAAWVDLKQMKVRSSETSRAVPPLEGASTPRRIY